MVVPAFGLSSIGLPELLVVAAIVVLLFGARRIPEIFSAFGKSMKSFQDAQRDEIDTEEPEKKLQQ